MRDDETDGSQRPSSSIFVHLRPSSSGLTCFADVLGALNHDNWERRRFPATEKALNRPLCRGNVLYGLGSMLLLLLTMMKMMMMRKKKKTEKKKKVKERRILAEESRRVDVR